MSPLSPLRTNINLTGLVDELKELCPVPMFEDPNIVNAVIFGTTDDFAGLPVGQISGLYGMIDDLLDRYIGDNPIRELIRNRIGILINGTP